MKHALIIIMAAVAVLSLSSCKKDDEDKLFNPLGLMITDTDTTLEDGRYVLRTDYGCSGFANVLSCDNADEVLTMNTPLYPIDHIVDMDTTAVWYVKKVRYQSPDPYYRRAFAYRIYQFRPNGAYRFLAVTTFATPDKDRYDNVGDGGGASVKAGVIEKEYYPRDPDVPTAVAIGIEPEEPETRFLLRFYKSKENPVMWGVEVGGQIAGNGAITNAWKMATGYWDEEACDGNALPLHFRSQFDGCESVDPSSGASRRCYVDEFVFQKVY